LGFTPRANRCVARTRIALRFAAWQCVEHASRLASSGDLRDRRGGANVAAPLDSPRSWTDAAITTRTTVNAVTPLRHDSSSDNAAPALRECVTRAVRRFLVDLGGNGESDLYRLMLHEIETPLLAEVMRHCRGNQSRAAQLLGITRTTLRKKLAERGLD
jgi:Fis family transcriptional regulator